MIARLLRHARLTLVLLAGATGLMAWQAGRIRFDFSMDRLFETGSAESEDHARFARDFGADDDSIIVAVGSHDVFRPETLAALRDLQDAVKKRPGVKAVYGLPDAAAFAPPGRARQEILASPLFRGSLVSADGQVACLWVALRDEVDTAEERKAELEALRETLRGRPGEFHLVGLPVIEHEYVELTRRDLATFLPIAGVVFFVLLALYYRTAAGTLLPLLAVGTGIAWILGLMSLGGVPLSLLSSLLPTLILVLGIADVVHLLDRYREDLADLSEKREALSRTLRLMIGACFLTSFTTGTGFASLATTEVRTIREFGLLTAAGILLSYLLSMTLLPSALALLPPFRPRAAGTSLWDRPLAAVARLNARRPWAVALAVAALLAAAVPGLLRLRRESSWLHDLRSDNAVHRDHMFFEERLSGAFPLELRLDGPVRDLAWLGKVQAFQIEIARWRESDRFHVRHAAGFVDLVKDLNRARLLGAGPRVLPATQAEYDACLALYDRLPRPPGLPRLADPEGRSCRLTVRMAGMTSSGLDRFSEALRKLHAPYASEIRLTVTGKTWLAKRAMDRVITNMLWSLGLASLVIFGAMALLFRSLRVGLLCILPNALPMLLTAGFMGWMGIDLNFSTVTVFSISLGIAVNTTIHYLARLRAELPLDADPRAAMARAVRGAGGPMIFSTLLLILGFGAILTSNFVFTFHFGLLGGFALLAALFGDLFVTPVLFVAFPPSARRLP